MYVCLCWYVKHTRDPLCIFSFLLKQFHFNIFYTGCTRQKAVQHVSLRLVWHTLPNKGHAPSDFMLHTVYNQNILLFYITASDPNVEKTHPNQNIKAKVQWSERLIMMSYNQNYCRLQTQIAYTGFCYLPFPHTCISGRGGGCWDVEKDL